MSRKRPLSRPKSLLDSSTVNSECSRVNGDASAKRNMPLIRATVPTATNSTCNATLAKGSLTEPDFHRLFVTAILKVGVRVASPSKIAEQMHLLQHFPYLKTEHIKSHLQRFRKTSEAGKAKFLEEYDRFLESLDQVDQQNQTPGAFGMVDLNKVLGGKVPALLSRATSMDMEYQQQQQPQKRGKATEAVPPAANIMDCIFVRTRMPSGVAATKVPAPILTPSEKETPIGRSLHHVMGLLRRMDQFLLEKRGVQMVDNPAAMMMMMAPPPPRATTTTAATTVVSVETLQRQQLQRERQERARMRLARRRTNGSARRKASSHATRVSVESSSKRKRNPELQKLLRLVADINRSVGNSARRKQRRLSENRTPRVTFSVNNDNEYESDDSSSGASSSSETSEPNQKESAGDSTISTNSASPHLRSSSADARIEKYAGWIFEGIPKPADLHGASILDMSSSSSSLSTDSTARPRKTHSGTVEARQMVFQRTRSHSDVSAILRDDEDLYVDENGNIRTGRSLQKLSVASDIPTILEEDPAASPSPSPDEMMDYVESSLFRDNPEMTAVALESNWQESGFLVQPELQQEQPSYFAPSRSPWQPVEHPEARAPPGGSYPFSAYTSNSLLPPGPANPTVLPPSLLGQIPLPAYLQHRPSHSLSPDLMQLQQNQLSQQTQAPPSPLQLAAQFSFQRQSSGVIATAIDHYSQQQQQFQEQNQDQQQEQAQQQHQQHQQQLYSELLGRFFPVEAFLEDGTRNDETS